MPFVVFAQERHLFKYICGNYREDYFSQMSRLVCREKNPHETLSSQLFIYLSGSEMKESRVAVK